MKTRDKKKKIPGSLSMAEKLEQESEKHSSNLRTAWNKSRVRKEVKGDMRKEKLHGEKPRELRKPFLSETMTMTRAERRRKGNCKV